MTASFESIIGHEQQRSQLLALKKNDAVPHSLLFSGPAAIGKRTLALAFAGMLLTKDSASDAEKDHEIGLLHRGSHPDFHPVFRESEKKDLSVDKIREVCSKLQLKPYSSAASVALIDNAEEMSIAASNALLMTLEEPPPHSFIILISQAPHRLPETIISRCQCMHFGSHSEAALKKILQRLLPASPEICAKLLPYTEGSLSALGLDKLIDPLTLKPHDQAQLLEHCQHFLKESARLSRLIERAFEGSGGESGVVSIASELAAEKEALPLVWQLIRTHARTLLRKSNSSAVALRAELILEAITAAERSSERSLNPPLQISSVLLRANDASRA